MRTLALVLTVMGSSLTALAAKPIDIATLEQLLKQAQEAHKSDAAIAHDISALELTEELTTRELQRITVELRPGPQTAEAVEMLADASAMLPPPAKDVPASSPPAMGLQRTMYTAALDYVANTLRHLPDFFATRETHSFNDLPSLVSNSGFSPITAMHAVGIFQREITFRGGKEVLLADRAALRKVPWSTGLSTWGEFGPVLSIILTDSLHGRVTWSRWEDGADGRMAVFHYEVPKAASHYQVDYCCA
jgi:hypothetical protein